MISLNWSSIVFILRCSEWTSLQLQMKRFGSTALKFKVCGREFSIHIFHLSAFQEAITVLMVDVRSNLLFVNAVIWLHFVLPMNMSIFISPSIIFMKDLTEHLSNLAANEENVKGVSWLFNSDVFICLARISTSLD